MSRIIIVFILLLPITGFSQEEIYSRENGILTFGTRSSVTLSPQGDNVGTGFGGVMRLKFSRRINSEWFADYITSNIAGLARKTDNQLGGAVLFYPFNSFVEQGRKIPFLVLGQALVNSRITKNGLNGETASQWYPLANAGIGGHWYFTNKFDFSLSCQYMQPLGRGIEASEFSGSQGEREITINENVRTPGYFFLNLSFNATIADLWGK